MTLLTDLAEFVTAARFESLSQAHRATADRHLADTAIALLAGARIAEGQALLPLAGFAELPDRIGLMAASARLTEIDDIHLPSCTTPSSVAVPVALAIAAEGGTGDLKSAIWAGVQLITRLGEAILGPQILYAGVWPTYLAAPFGAAAVASRLWKLDTKQTAHALSLALMLGSGGIGRFTGSPSGRWFLFASAVASGIRAALAAKAGYLGDLNLLDGDWFTATHGLAFDRGRLAGSQTDNPVYPELSLKPYCSSKQSISAVEALGQLLDQGLDPETISRLVVRVPPPYAGMVRIKAVAGARSSTLVSLAHQLAVRAYDRDGLYDIDRSQLVLDPRLEALAGKVEIEADTRLLADYPRLWPAVIDITAKGQIHTARVSASPGDPEMALNDDGVTRKGRLVLSRIAGADAAQALLAHVAAGFETPARCRAFLDLAVGPLTG